jgi:Fe-S-cluster containining protein
MFKLEKAFELVDSKFLKEDVSCKKGCSYCCYCIPKVSLTEIKFIIDKYGFPDVELIKEMEKNGKCIYLINDECSIYDARPILCRGYGVFSHPKFCSINSKERPIVLNNTYVLRILELTDNKLYDLPFILWKLYNEKNI